MCNILQSNKQQIQSRRKPRPETDLRADGDLLPRYAEVKKRLGLG